MRQGLSTIAAKNSITAQWLFQCAGNYWTLGNTITYDSNTYTSKIITGSFDGVQEKNTRYADRLIAPNETSFSVVGDKTDFSPPDFIGEEVLVYLLIDDALSFSWRFHVKSCFYAYGAFQFTCEDFLQKYLFNNYFPNTELLNNLNTTTAQFAGPDNACIPEVFGQAYRPLRMIPDSDEWFPVLGIASGTYTIDKVSSPVEFDQKSTYEPPTYTFTQSTKSGLRVFSNDIAADGSNAPFGKSGKLYDTVTQYSNSLTLTTTNPADVISYILQKLGVPLSQIDTTGTFATSKALYTQELITYQYSFTTKEDAVEVLCQLLESCNSILPRSDVVQLIFLEDTTPVKTLDRENILDLSFNEYVYSEDFDGGYAQYYTDVQDGEPSEIAIAINGTSYTNISAEKVLYRFIYDTTVIQRLSIIDYRRKFLKTGTLSFSSNHSMIEPYLGDRIQITDDLYENYENAYIDSIKIKADLKIEFGLDTYSETIGDMSDYNPTAVIKAEDLSPVIKPLSDRWLKVIYQRSATQPETPSGDEPVGWYETIPAGSDPLWESSAWFGNDNKLLLGSVWSTPLQKDGTPGEKGDPGPGLTFTGVYSATKAYYKTSIKQDIALDDLTSTYYACIASNTGEPLSNPLYWQALASFESVATDILLAVDATILKSLLIGATGAGAHLENCSVRSGQTAYDTGNGWFLGREGNYPRFSLRNALGQFLRFSENNLEVSGLTVTSASGVGNFTDAGNLATQDRNDLDYIDGADPTALNTAANIAGQGTLATKNSADWQTQVLGTGKPDDNADVTTTTINGGVITTGYIRDSLSNLVVDFANSKITVANPDGLTVSSGGGVTIESGGGLDVKTGGDITLTAAASNPASLFYEDSVGNLIASLTANLTSFYISGDLSTTGLIIQNFSTMSMISKTSAKLGCNTSYIQTTSDLSNDQDLDLYCNSTSGDLVLLNMVSHSATSYFRTKVGLHSIQMISGIEVHTGVASLAFGSATYDSKIPSTGDWFFARQPDGQPWMRYKNIDGNYYSHRLTQ